MSKELNTKEKEIARFNELKAIGYKTLKGADREEYSTLKEKYPELESEEKTDSEGKKGDETEKTSEKKDEETDGDSDENVNEEEFTKEVEQNYFVLKGNVLHNGDTYTKGQKILKNDPLVATFKEIGLLE